LIIGLGNPGRIYKHSRHNVGFLIIDRLAKNWGIKIKPDKVMRFSIGKGKVGGKDVILAKPLCFMNLSGYLVKHLLDKLNLSPQEEMLVVCDDLDLEWGKIRIRPRDSSAGHKGVESIIKSLGCSDFARLRFGIGRPQKTKVVEYVLSSWTKNEKRELGDYLERAADCCETWVIWGIHKAMNEFN